MFKKQKSEGVRIFLERIRIITYFLIFSVIDFYLKRSIMNTKLTLSIEQSLIEKAKRYAKGKGRSLSDIVENYLKIITRETKDIDI